MTTKEVLKQTKDFFEMEYKNTLRVSTHNELFCTQELTKYCVRDALARCLGVALFVQQLNVSYLDVKAVYEEYKEKFDKLLDN